MSSKAQRHSVMFDVHVYVKVINSNEVAVTLKVIHGAGKMRTSHLAP